jgi:hypothetical protein
MRWSVFKIGANKPHSLDRDDVFGGRATVDRRVSDGDRLRTVGEPDPCTRTSRRTRGTTT